jgi:hypothetical protein
MSNPVTKARTKRPSSKVSFSQVPAAARKQLYASFREHTEEVKETLLSILRDEEADNKHRIQAGKEILNRGWGQAASVEIIEAVFKHEHSISLDGLKQLSSAQLTELEAMLSKVVTGDVIDAEVVEQVESETNP